MNLVIVSGSAVDAAGAPHPSRAAAERLAAARVAAGDRVRWLCPLVGDEAEPRVGDGVELECHRAARRPAFRSVLDRVFDLGLERLVTQRLRADPPDLTVVLACGGTTSTELPWIASRLGVPVLVLLGEIEETLCHRRTLIDERGAACDRFDDADRCVTCCLTPATSRDADGLGPFGAWLGRRLQGLGDASPFPNRTEFINRLDALVGSLVNATAIVVPNPAAAAALTRLGVPERLVHADPAASRGDPSAVEPWLRRSWTSNSGHPTQGSLSENVTQA